jgi:hypothetical protein
MMSFAAAFNGDDRLCHKGTSRAVVTARISAMVARMSRCDQSSYVTSAMRLHLEEPAQKPRVGV